MSQGLSDELIALSAMMLTAQTRGEFVALSSKMNDLVEQVMQLERHEPQRKEKTLSATIKFSKEEVAKMSKTFKKEFIAAGLVAHIIKRPSGKNGFYYEIRYRRNGFNISVSDKDLKKAKEKFIERTNRLESPTPKKNLTFGVLAQEWLIFKQGKIVNSTWKIYQSYIRRFVPDNLSKKDIRMIRAGDLNEVMKDVSPRTYEELRIVFNSIFKYCIASGVITHNPVDMIPFAKSERTPRTSLGRSELNILIERLKDPTFSPIRAYVSAMLYCGLRPCEADAEAHVENSYMICRNRKRKRGKIEYKKIPVPKEAREVLKEGVVFSPPYSSKKMRDIMHELLGEHTPYSLRHTFSTVCAEAVRQEIVEIWLGDSPERLVGKFYVHYSDEFFRKEMDKVVFYTPNHTPNED